MAYHVWPEMFMRAFFFRLALVSATSPSVTWQVQATFAAPLLEEELRLSCPDSLTYQIPLPVSRAGLGKFKPADLYPADPCRTEQ